MEAVKNLPAPLDKSQLRSFPDMVTYVRRFIPEFADISAPLSELLQDGRRFFLDPGTGREI